MHDLCFFLICLCSKIIFEQKMFSLCWDKLNHPGSIAYLSCFLSALYLYLIFSFFDEPWHYNCLWISLSGDIMPWWSNDWSGLCKLWTHFLADLCVGNTPNHQLHSAQCCWESENDVQWQEFMQPCCQELCLGESMSWCNEICWNKVHMRRAYNRFVNFQYNTFWSWYNSHTQFLNQLLWFLYLICLIMIIYSEKPVEYLTD